MYKDHSFLRQTDREIKRMCEGEGRGEKRKGRREGKTEETGQREERDIERETAERS